VADLLLLNFGTFQETNRFKRSAIQDAFVSSDLMDGVSPGDLLRTGGLRTVNAAGTTTYSFYGLRSDVWKAKLPDGTAYRDAFKKWIENILTNTVHCVYLTGHHGGHQMWWDHDPDDFWMRLTKIDELVFGAEEKHLIKLTAKNLRTGCLLVLGFGCNIGSGGNSSFYQDFFHNGAEKPIVLGWDTTIAVPRSNWPSINDRFFEYLNQYVKSNSSVAAKDRLDWFYGNQPMELVRAWGHAARGYEGHKSQSRLWEHARARHKDGTLYRFEVQKGVVQPVKA